MEPTYEKVFLDKLSENIKGLEGKLTSKDGKVTESIENTCHFARALHQTFSDMTDVGMMLLIGAACDFTPINEKEATKK